MLLSKWMSVLALTSNKLNAVFEMGFQEAAAGLLDSMKTVDRSSANRDRLHSK